MTEKSYSVRCFFEWSAREGMKKKHLYEERITIWKTSDFDQAIELAEKDAKIYAESIDAEYLELAQGFYLFDDIESSGKEIYSLLRESNLKPEKYLDRFFDTGFEHQREWKPPEN
jgi:hypothetical protein